MRRNGWSYLVVTFVRTTPPTDPPYKTVDNHGFATEAEMFSELGVTGWELVTIRETPQSLLYYFKRGRT